MAKFSPASRPRLADEIGDYLREQIYTGHLAPGTQLRQEQLADELDVSRTPLREALRVLQSEGLLAVRRGNRVEVVSHEGGRFLDALLVREVIDGAAARLCAEAGLTSRQRTVFDRALRAQEDSLDPWDRAAFARGDADLHTAVLNLSGNVYLAQQVNLIRLTIQVFQIGAQFGSYDAASDIEEHRSIVNAITAQDPLAAEEHARAHLRRVIEELQRAAVSAT